MTTESGVRFCVVCDKPIKGHAERIPQFSSSGARPDNWRHLTCYSRRR
ncbi:hypothetical protein OHS70_23570 [Streptomyces sp. NBC_00390]